MFGDENFDSGPWRFRSSMGLPEKFRISVVRTFGTGFDVGESIFWALKKSGQVLLKLLSPTNRRHGGILRTFRCPHRLENCFGYLAIEADQRRDGFLLCLTGQTVIL